MALKLMENKRNRMDNFSRNTAKNEKAKTEKNGVGYFKGTRGPNIIIEKLH
jgi:hypothetical protein